MRRRGDGGGVEKCFGLVMRFSTGVSVRRRPEEGVLLFLAKTTAGSLFLDLSQCFMKRCNRCSTFSPEADPFCSKCGASFGVKLCRPLGHRNALSARYCGTCGSDRLSEPHRTRRITRRQKLILWLLLGTTTILAVGGVVVTLLVTKETQLWRTVLLVGGVLTLLLFSGGRHPKRR